MLCVHVCMCMGGGGELTYSHRPEEEGSGLLYHSSPDSFEIESLTEP